jgi:hypothetical protein
MVNKRLTGWAPSAARPALHNPLTPSRQTRREANDGAPQDHAGSECGLVLCVGANSLCPLLGRPRFRMPGNWRVGVQHDASSINLHFGLVGMQDDNKVPGKNRDMAGISP